MAMGTDKNESGVRGHGHVGVTVDEAKPIPTNVLITKYPPAVGMFSGKEDEAYYLDLSIKSRHLQVNELAFHLAFDLYKMDTKKLFKKLGYRSFNAYLADPEVGINRATAFKLVAIYRDLIQDQSIQKDHFVEIGQDKLAIICPYKVEHPDLLEELLADAKALSKTDLRKQLRDRFNDQEVMLPVIHVTWESIADGLYADLLNVTHGVEIPSMQRYKQMKDGDYDD
jgi:hypothetical protein